MRPLFEKEVIAMKLSKILTRCIALLLALSCLFLAVACGKEDTEAGDTSDVSDNGNVATEAENVLEIIKGGKSDYVLTYSKAMPHYESLAQRVSTMLFAECGALLPVTPFSMEGKKQILVGTFTDNDDYNAVKDSLAATGDYAIAVSGESLVLYATNEQYSVNLIFKLIELISDREDKTELCFSDRSNYIHSKSGEELMAVNSIEYVEEYRAMFNTYGTYADEQFAAERYAAARSDQALIEALKTRIGKSAVFYVGDTRAIYDGYYRKLDTADYTNGAIRSANNLLIPAEFAREYFGEGISTDSYGYFNVSAYCASSSEYSLYNDGDKLYIVYPSDVKAFDGKDTVVGGYTNQKYIDRLNRFFTDEFLPEPTVNTEQSRVVIAESLYPENVADCKNQKYVTTYSPAIAVNTVGGTKTIYASYEYTTVVYRSEIVTCTALSVSTDDGKTWTEIARVDDLRWASMFIVDNTVYLLGNSLKDGSVMIARLKSDNTFESATIATGAGGGAPCTVTVHNGRIYSARGKVLSADVDSNLMLAESWSQSANIATLLSDAWYKQVANDPNSTYKISAGEGNIVVGPDGKLYGIYRINVNAMDGYAAILEISDDGKEISYVESCDSLIVMGTTRSKFSVRYDETSGLYYSLVSTPTVEKQHFQRTVLSLVYSSDLINWTTATSVLVDREIMNEDYAAFTHGFQYADFVFDGDDIIMVVRETTGYSNYFHDGKYTTFYRLEDFRELVR